MQQVLGSPWALFFSAYGLLAFAVLLRHHATRLVPWAVCLFPLEYLFVEPDAPGIPWCALAFGIVAIAWALSGRWATSARLPADGLHWGLGLFVLWSVLSLLVNRNWDSGLIALTKLLYGLSAYVICRAEGIQLRQFLAPLSVAGVVIGIDLIAHEILGASGDGTFGWQGHGRACVNILANMEVLLVAAWLPFLPSLSGRRRAAVLALLAYAVVTILAGASRQAALSLCVVLFLWSIRRPDLRRRVALLLVAGLLVMALGGSTIALARRFQTLLASADGNATEDVSVKFRRLAMRIGVEMFRDHPVLGVGPGGYPARSIDYATPEMLAWRGLTTSPEVKYTSPHSLYLRIADEGGLPGLLLFVGVLAGVAWRAARRFRGVSPTSGAMGLLLILVPLYVGTLVSDSLRWSPVMWGFLGMASAALRGGEKVEAAAI